MDGVVQPQAERTFCNAKSPQWSPPPPPSLFLSLIARSSFLPLFCSTSKPSPLVIMNHCWLCSSVFIVRRSLCNATNRPRVGGCRRRAYFDSCRIESDKSDLQVVIYQCNSVHVKIYIHCNQEQTSTTPIPQAFSRHSSHTTSTNRRQPWRSTVRSSVMALGLMVAAVVATSLVGLVVAVVADASRPVSVPVLWLLRSERQAVCP